MDQSNYDEHLKLKTQYVTIKNTWGQEKRKTFRFQSGGKVHRE